MKKTFWFGCLVFLASLAAACGGAQTEGQAGLDGGVDGGVDTVTDTVADLAAQLAAEKAAREEAEKKAAEAQAKLDAEQAARAAADQAAAEAAAAKAAEDAAKAAAEAAKPKYPKPPERNGAGRSPEAFNLTIDKVFVMPLKASGACWDEPCGSYAQQVGSAMSMLGGSEPSPTKYGLATAIVDKAAAFSGNKTAFPDVYVVVDCGFGNAHRSSFDKGTDKLIAEWPWERKTMNLDVNDECAISVWDKDDGDAAEEIGRIVVPLRKRLSGDKVTLNIKNGFGSVYWMEISLRKPGTEPTTGGGTTGGGTTSGGTTGGVYNPPLPPAKPVDTTGAVTYDVTIVKAKIAAKKKEGTTWDAFKDTGPDTFVEAWVNGYQSPRAFLTTAVLKETTDAQFGTAGQALAKPSDKIVFMVWDKDLADNDLIGECKTKEISKEKPGTMTFKNCGQVELLEVQIQPAGN